jgi:hypothetical protein
MTMGNENLRKLLEEAHALLLGLGEPECYAEECGVCGPIDEMAARIDAALAEPVSDDFRRGAEAMREAAAKDCIDFWGAGHTSGTLQAERIRALPIPEDK